MKNLAIASITCLVSGLALAAIDAEAAIRVQCEQRGAQRAKVSVDADGLAAGTYRASVLSNGVEVFSAPAAADGDEVQFDFDSNPNDIASGATAISPTFAASGSVTGKVVNSRGMTVVSDTVACRLRNR